MRQMEEDPHEWHTRIWFYYIRIHLWMKLTFYLVLGCTDQSCITHSPPTHYSCWPNRPANRFICTLFFVWMVFSHSSLVSHLTHCTVHKPHNRSNERRTRIKTKEKRKKQKTEELPPLMHPILINMWRGMLSLMHSVHSINKCFGCQMLVYLRVYSLFFLPARRREKIVKTSQHINALRLL